MMMVYEISEAGTVTVPIDSQNKYILDFLDQAKHHYKRVGFKKPWVSFLAFEKGVCWGMCGYKAPPADGKLEIFYSPLPDQNREEVQMDMVRKVVEIALFHDKESAIVIRTPAKEDDQTQLLTKFGFSKSEISDEKSNKVWEWRVIWGGKKTPSPGELVVVRK